MTALASFLDTRSTRVAVVLAAVLHAAALFGFAQYDHTRSSVGHRHAVPAPYPPVEVIFVAMPTPPVQVAHAPVATPTPIPLVPRKPAPEALAQLPFATPRVVQPVVAAAAVTASPTAPAAAVGSEEAKPEAPPAQPVQAAKPDYAYNPQPDYPLLLREQGVGGVVWLRVWVDSEGHPGEIKLAKGSGYRLLDDSAMRAVRQWRFTPARRGDNKLASWVEFPIRFTLNG